MVAVDEAVEQGFLAPAAPYLDPGQGLKVFERGFDRARIDGHGGDAKLPAAVDAVSLPRGQPDTACTLQLEQQTTTDDLFQMPIGLPPVPLTANLLGDGRTASVPLFIRDPLDELDFLWADALSTVGDGGLHGPSYSRNGVRTPEVFQKKFSRCLNPLPSAKELPQEYKHAPPSWRH
jgi:hypothetical protein